MRVKSLYLVALGPRCPLSRIKFSVKAGSSLSTSQVHWQWMGPRCLDMVSWVHQSYILRIFAPLIFTIWSNFKKSKASQKLYRFHWTEYHQLNHLMSLPDTLPAFPSPSKSTSRLPSWLYQSPCRNRVTFVVNGSKGLHLPRSKIKEIKKEREYKGLEKGLTAFTLCWYCLTRPQQ